MATSPKIFICYAESRRRKAEELFDRLQRIGATPWLDQRRLLIGDIFEQRIREAIDSSDGFVVLLDPEFEGVGFRQREVRWALEALERRPLHNKFIFPFIVQSCALPSWCAGFHAGDPSRPTSMDAFLYSIANHFQLPWPTGPAVAAIRVGGAVSQDQQLETILDLAHQAHLDIVDTLFVDVTDREGLLGVTQLSDERRIDNVFVYSFSAIARETFENLAAAADFFRPKRIALRSVTERIEFGGGYAGNGPVVTSDNERCSVEERRTRVAALKTVFESYVHGDDGRGQACVHCGGSAMLYDQRRSGGSVDYYRTLKCCSRCYWYRIEPEYWTTNY